MSVKGHVIGKGKPIICIPIIQKSMENILNEIELLTKRKTEMIEWRIDFFEYLKEEDKIKEVLKEANQKLTNCIFLVTYRSKKQGGNGSLEDKEYQNLLYFLAKQKEIDFLDVEIYSLKNPKELILKLKEGSIKIIASHHDFDKTPSREDMERFFFDMHESNADVLKLAVMPCNKKDVLLLLDVTVDVQLKYAPTPIVTMSMGREGMMSRFLGELCGSAITFGTFENASAPGQIDSNKLEQILQIIHQL